jgi:hypothetical protein
MSSKNLTTMKSFSRVQYMKITPSTSWKVAGTVIPKDKRNVNVSL